MAQKRMFDKTITNSDEFLELPDSSQVLYFHLSMNADDDGFVNNWKSILKMTGTKEDDLKILIAKSFIIPFDSGVIVIKHWRINNFLRKDRHIDTKYKEELSMLKVNENEEYTILVNQWSTQYSIEENSIDKNNIYMTTPKIDFNDEFEQLWSEYPRKEGKKKSLEYYIRARKKGTTFEQVMKGIKEYKKHIDRKRVSSQYISQGSSWFNQERWNDDYSAERSYLEIMREEEENEQRRSESTT